MARRRSIRKRSASSMPSDGEPADLTLLAKVRQLEDETARLRLFGRYIVTVPGRGYRFVAEVRETGGTAEDGADGKTGSAQDKLEGVPQSTLNGRKWAIAAAIVLLLLAGIGGLSLASEPRPQTVCSHPCLDCCPALRRLEPGQRPGIFLRWIGR